MSETEPGHSHGLPVIGSTLLAEFGQFIGRGVRPVVCQVKPVWSLITAITSITLITSILLAALFATLFLPLFDALVLTQSASFRALLVTLASSWPTAATSPVTHWITVYNNVHGTHMQNMQVYFATTIHTPERSVVFDISQSWNYWI